MAAIRAQTAAFAAFDGQKFAIPRPNRLNRTPRRASSGGPIANLADGNTFGRSVESQVWPVEAFCLSLALRTATILSAKKKLFRLFTRQHFEQQRFEVEVYAGAGRSMQRTASRSRSSPVRCELSARALRRPGALLSGVRYSKRCQ